MKNEKYKGEKLWENHNSISTAFAALSKN